MRAGRLGARRGGARCAARRARRRPLRLLDRRGAAPDAVLPRQPPGGGDRRDRPRRSSACATEVGELSVGAPLWLPPRRPRALAVEIHDDDGRARRPARRPWQGAAGEAVGWEPERRRFRAHVTVARAGGRAPRAGPATGSARASPARHAAAALHAGVDRPVPLLAVAGGRQLRGAGDVRLSRPAREPGRASSAFVADGVAERWPVAARQRAARCLRSGFGSAPHERTRRLPGPRCCRLRRPLRRLELA